MQTYKYRFPAEGQIDKEHADAARELTADMKNGPDCLAAWCIFPSDSNILDHISFELEGKDFPFRVTAVDIHTYTQPYEGTEQDFKDCVAGNLENVLSGVNLTGDMKFMGKEGDIPKTMYHITERENLDSIMKNGLVPDSGKNQYKSHENYIYLAGENDLAPWLSILPYMEDPVLLKVDTSDLSGIEQGRVFDDRDYVEGGQYTEYRTIKNIPSSAVSLVNTAEDKEFFNRLENSLLKQIGKEGESKEPERGYERFQTFHISENDFTKAVENIPYQMTLADYGMM